MTKRRPKNDARDAGEEKSGWESLTEEAAGGALAPNEELEDALREAAEAVDARSKAAKRPRSEPASPQGARVEQDGGGPPQGKTQQEPGGAPDEGTEEKPATALGEAGPRPAPKPAEGEPGADRPEEASDRLVRLQADFENFRRRTLKEREEAHNFGYQNLVKELLPTVDNLERAIEHAQQSGDADSEGLLQGVELVRRELLGVLAKYGVIEIEAEGKPFDPAVHEAMTQTPDASVPENTVVRVFQKGYALRDRLLRPAQVVVSVAPQSEEASAEGESAD